MAADAAEITPAPPRSAPAVLPSRVRRFYRRAGLLLPIVHFFRPFDENVIWELLLRIARLRIIGLNNGLLILICATALASLYWQNLILLMILGCAILYVGLLLPAMRFRRNLARLEQHDMIFAVPLTNHDFTQGFMHYFMLATTVAALPYLLFLYLGYMHGLAPRWFNRYYEWSGVAKLISMHLATLAFCWAAFWCAIAGGWRWALLLALSLYYLLPSAFVIWNVLRNPSWHYLPSNYQTRQHVAYFIRRIMRDFHFGTTANLIYAVICVAVAYGIIRHCRRHYIARSQKRLFS